jgi:hypothetical protein
MILLLLILVSAVALAAARYEVGPERKHCTLQEVVTLLEPGDVVEVDGDAVYPGGVEFTRAGTAEAPITIRGLRRNGKRPVISGGEMAVHFLLSNHTIFEGFEIEHGSARGIRYRAAYMTIRDLYMHDCPDQGILGSDYETGPLTLEYVEVARCGGAPGGHSIYISTDPVAYPGAVFRMQHCYVHDCTWGNCVKTRAERNEIRYNWLESDVLRALVLIGRDDERGPRPMHSEAIGNVLISRSDLPVVQVGHDGKEYGSRGRHRLVNNTLLVSEHCPDAIQARSELESVEMHNNVFHRLGGGSMLLLNEETAQWTKGRRICSGQNNWVSEGAEYPSEWTGSRMGTDPGFVDLANYDLRLAPRSPLVGAGAMDLQSPLGYPFPDPFLPPASLPPRHTLEAVGTARPRPPRDPIDVGAYAYEEEE